MSILKVHIHNFKSYADEKVENIGKHTNLFVGRNGHGKSNLFAGI
jgi:AAA15 family ATPase/GTPase